MQAYELDTSADISFHHPQSGREPQVEEERLPCQLDRSPIGKRLGGPPNMDAHAGLLNRVVAAQPARAGQIARQLQRQYGNRYVAQVAAQARASGLVVQPKLVVTPPTDNVNRPSLLLERRQGLPDDLKARIESLSGLSMDDVKVHYNAAEPARLQALAYTQGPHIYLGPGQEQHLPHEAWHVVQQKQGRVKPTLQANGVAINDDPVLEVEADHLGQQAASSQLPAPAKEPLDPAQHALPVNVSAPIPAGDNSYKIVVGAGQQQVGSVMVHARDITSIEVTDLGAAPTHRKQGLGGVLMASALQTGRQLGKSKVSLASQDNGSGRLTDWYRNMGFAQVGVNQLDYPQLEAPISRILTGVAQGRRAPLPTSQNQIHELRPSNKVANSLSLPPKMAGVSNSTFTMQRMEGSSGGKRLRGESRSARVQSGNVAGLVEDYIQENTRKVLFNMSMRGGWERWFQGEIFFLLTENLGAVEVNVEEQVYTGAQRADFTLETTDNTLIIIELKCQTQVESQGAFQGRVNGDWTKLSTKLNFAVTNALGARYDNIQAFQLVLSIGNTDTLHGKGEHDSKVLDLSPQSSVTLSIQRTLWSHQGGGNYQKI